MTRPRSKDSPRRKRSSMRRAASGSAGRSQPRNSHRIGERVTVGWIMGIRIVFASDRYASGYYTNFQQRPREHVSTEMISTEQFGEVAALLGFGGSHWQSFLHNTLARSDQCFRTGLEE